MSHAGYLPGCSAAGGGSQLSLKRQMTSSAVLWGKPCHTGQSREARRPRPAQGPGPLTLREFPEVGVGCWAERARQRKTLRSGNPGKPPFCPLRTPHACISAAQAQPPPHSGGAPDNGFRSAPKGSRPGTGRLAEGWGGHIRPGLTGWGGLGGDRGQTFHLAGFGNSFRNRKSR
ncbi:hypothetical protein HJG60_011124 [Phyllostomus discolor]|uniref:Uncharacterized protein n=1 Tax=Phyllostomus discolor TaxID=89673 RepID=A0A834A754_9CHIR|nr:hypothetical protein HJG60_011124 [Phyllostomus discolor]